MKPRRTINRITLLSFISTVLLQGINFFTLPIFSRMMSAESYGIFVNFTTWMGIVSCIFGLQVSSSLMVVSTTLPREEQESYQSSVLALSFLSFGCFSLLMVLFKDNVLRLVNLPENLFFLLLATAWTRTVVLFADAKYQAEFEAEKKFFISILGTGLGVLLSLWLVFVIPEEINYLARVWGNLIPNTIISITICTLVFRRGKTFFRLDYWKMCLGISIPFVFHLLSSTVLSSSDRVMIQRILGDSHTGIYGLGYSFASIILIINGALNSSWTPFYLKYLAEEENEKINKHARNYAELFTIICSGFILLSPEVYRTFVGKEFQEGVKYISLFVIADFFVFLYTFPVNFEYHCKKSKIIASATIFSALFNMVANYFLIHFIGIAGALIATIASNMLLFVGHYSCARFVIKEHEYPLTIKLFLPYLGALLMIVALCGILGYNGALLRWGIGAVLGIIELRRIIQRKSIL